MIFFSKYNASHRLNQLCACLKKVNFIGQCHGVPRRMISVDNFFIFIDYYFCFVVATCDLVHGVDRQICPNDHCLASRDSAKGQICLSMPHTNDRSFFFHSFVSTLELITILP